MVGLGVGGRGEAAVVEIFQPGEVGDHHFGFCQKPDSPP